CPSSLPGLKFARSRKIWRRTAASTAVFLVVLSPLGFFLAAAGRMALEINTATTTKRRTAFTQELIVATIHPGRGHIATIAYAAFHVCRLESDVLVAHRRSTCHL